MAGLRGVRGDAPITIKNYAYGSGSMTISQGDTVTWTNQDSVPHDVVVTSGPVKFRSPMLTKGKSWSYTFSQAGAYSYTCSVHPDMHATITAKAKAAAPAPAATTPAAAAPATGHTEATPSATHATPTPTPDDRRRPAAGTAYVATTADHGQPVAGPAPPAARALHGDRRVLPAADGLPAPRPPTTEGASDGD